MRLRLARGSLHGCVGFAWFGHEDGRCFCSFLSLTNGVQKSGASTTCEPKPTSSEVLFSLQHSSQASLSMYSAPSDRLTSSPSAHALVCCLFVSRFAGGMYTYPACTTTWRTMTHHPSREFFKISKLAQLLSRLSSPSYASCSLFYSRVPSRFSVKICFSSSSQTHPMRKLHKRDPMALDRSPGHRASPMPGSQATHLDQGSKAPVGARTWCIHMLHKAPMVRSQKSLNAAAQVLHNLPSEAAGLSRRFRLMLSLVK
jgi:hypothetical protein